jgi:hypothetical protein
MKADLLVLGHVLLLQATSVHDLLRLIYVNAVHLLADLRLILLDQFPNVGNVEIVTVLLRTCIHSESLLSAAAEVAGDLQLAIGLVVGSEHLQEDGGGDTVAGLAVLFLEVRADHMNRVPGPDLDSPALNLLLHEEASPESGHIGVEEIHRGEGVLLVEVVVHISRENFIEFLLQLEELT